MSMFCLRTLCLIWAVGLIVVLDLGDAVVRAVAAGRRALRPLLRGPAVLSNLLGGSAGRVLLLDGGGGPVEHGRSLCILSILQPHYDRRTGTHDGLVFSSGSYSLAVTAERSGSLSDGDNGVAWQDRNRSRRTGMNLMRAHRYMSRT